MGDEVPGSPIVILQAVAEAKARVMLEQRRRKDILFDVHLICIDKDPTAVEHLKHVLQDFGYGEKLRDGSITAIASDFSTISDRVISLVRSRSPKVGRSLFVLDQYGYDQVPVKALKSIFSSLRQAEVILTFNIDSIINFLNKKNAGDFERKIGLPDAIAAEDIDDPIRGPAWRLRVQARLYQRLTEGSGASFFTPFFIRPERGHGDFWLLHLSQHWKARDVMANAHWRHQNHFIHYGSAGFDMFSTGYAARIDDEDRPQTAFEFDSKAGESSLAAMMEQIPRSILRKSEGVRFRDFFVDRVNTTPATLQMVEQAVIQLVKEKAVEVVGDNGSLRHIRKAVQDDHILRLPNQQAMMFV
jgi:three-Cys-motif partner protein